MNTKNKILSGLIAGIVVLSVAMAALFTPTTALASSLEGRGGPGGRGNPAWGNPGTGNLGTGNPGTGNPGTGNQPSSGFIAQAPALTPLSEAEKEGLQDAILEEYGALNLYNAIMADFGQIAPFAQIARSEQQHINALLRMADKYGVAAPANPGLSIDPAFATPADACTAGATAEIADAALYDELKAFTTHTDLLQVYANLQRASLNSHLPAFEACN
jgi:hypothetical protein